MGKLKPRWMKTDIPKHVKVKLWQLMRDNPTYESWEKAIVGKSYTSDQDKLFASDELDYIKMSRDTYKALKSEVMDMPTEEVLSLPPDLQSWIKQLRPDLESEGKTLAEPVWGEFLGLRETSEPPLGFDQDQWTSLTEMIEKGFLFMVGQNIAAQLATLEPRVMRSFGCHDIGLKDVQHALSLYPSRRLDAWLDNIRSVESSLLRRKTIQEQILIDAKNGYESLGSVEPVDNNFALAAYHFMARGDSTWLKDDRFQTLDLGPLGSWCPLVWCPLCDYNLRLQQWDTRGFTCPGHDVALIPRHEALPTGIGFTAEIQKQIYQETVTTVEDIVVGHPAKVVLSMHIARMLPFSELVIAVGETTSMPRLRRFVQNFLRTSPLGGEVRQNEEYLQQSYATLLDTLRSAPAVDAR